jgi:divalent metal cation (Fe/Co/Zn/Cd) transporter
MSHNQAEIGKNSSDRSSLTRFAWLSIAASLATIALKTTAYLLTGSVGFMSDAVESLVNLAAASGAGNADRLGTAADEPYVAHRRVFLERR